LNDPAEGGGRLLGEGVHFIDFLCGMLDADPVTVGAQGSTDGQNFVVTLRFPDDSLGTVIYTAQGDPGFAKERVEAFAGGGVAVLDDFRELAFSGMAGQSVKGKPDKGHAALLTNFGEAIQGKTDLAISGLDGLRATRIALAAYDSMRLGQTILLDEWMEDAETDA
jgi:predicted dehydrogenase